MLTFTYLLGNVKTLPKRKWLHGVQDTSLAIPEQIRTRSRLNFQAESKRAGDEFEAIVEQHLSKTSKITARNYEIPETGVEVDFVADNKVRTEFVEAKGGRSGGKKRPGAERTDNVKKAVANGAILKAVDPNTYYVVYFSAPPKTGSYADNMIKIALSAKYIDEIRYL